MTILTWRQLRDQINQLAEDRLDDSATFYDPNVDEYYPVEKTAIVKETDVLDAGHMIMVKHDGRDE